MVSSWESEALGIRSNASHSLWLAFCQVALQERLHTTRLHGNLLAVGKAGIIAGNFTANFPTKLSQLFQMQPECQHQMDSHRWLTKIVHLCSQRQDCVEVSSFLKLCYTELFCFGVFVFKGFHLFWFLIPTPRGAHGLGLKAQTTRVAQLWHKLTMSLTF